MRASHVMGGEITWECQGAGYVFQLVFYRDCNGAEVNTVSENIRVWNHPTLTNITVFFQSRTDISPNCTPVAGSPVPLECGVGSNSGNGIGAIEKVVYKSAPVLLNGIPGPMGWIFTYENFSRSNNITNLSTPSIYGITLTAKMFNAPNSIADVCKDNSPVFLQEPYFVSCAGEPFRYNMNAVDPDLDSLAISFSAPLNNFPTGIYNPPTNPIPVPFVAGFSASSPTPNSTLDPGNITATVDPQSGEIEFTSFTIGNYVVKILVKSYRNGILISEVEREMQLVIMPCSTVNNPPVITAPFAGSFETTVDAGTLVNFTLTATDLEVLQDGTPQTNFLSASGPLFGTNFTSTSGCDIQPCATLNATPIISGTQGVATNFSWQTDCDHLVGTNGIALDTIPYHFVFRVQDDFCQIPKVSYATVTIIIVNPGVIQATQINCIQTDIAGNLTINWNAVNDPFGTFLGYEIHSLQGGLLATETNIAVNSITIPAINTNNDFFISVISGCDGNTLRNSDTVANIHMNLVNPNNGTAQLTWNQPATPQLVSMNNYYHIYREYPAGTWTMIDSVSYATHNYLDTIDICEAFLSYQVVLPNVPCDFTSNIVGDDLEDMLTPNIPIISSATVDTLTGNVIISWNQNQQPDTYGYVVYTFDANGFIFELDTVWGIGNTNYAHTVNTDAGPLSYSVAAFDSCYTPAFPPTFQTSAKANVHTTIFASQELSLCDRQVALNWTNYIGWNDLSTYEIIGHEAGLNWSVYGATIDTFFTVDVELLKDYCFYIRAISASGDTSYSNKICLSVIAPAGPSFNYLQVASVDLKQIVIEHLIDNLAAVDFILIEKADASGAFVPLVQLPVVGMQTTYIDTDVDVQNVSYSYRVRPMDDCGNFGPSSNIAKTILLNLQKEDITLSSYLQWNPYEKFDGEVVEYTIFRGIDSVFSPSIYATSPFDRLSFQDQLTDPNFKGRVCYYVEAVEGGNIYNDPKISRSNIVCNVFEPLIYIPNSFTPEGINPCFYPEVSQFDPKDYRFVIFDRWGQEIFNSSDPNEQWCGKLSNGKFAETATYIYMLTIHDAAGNEIVKRGFVTLLR